MTKCQDYASGTHIDKMAVLNKNNCKKKNNVFNL